MVNLSDLDDVDLTTAPPADQDVLTYDGSKEKWVAKAAAGAAANAVLFEDFVPGENVILYTAPVLSSSFNSTAFLTTDNIVIPYTVTNTGMGGLTAAYVVDGGAPVSTPITNGNQVLSVGALPAGTHSLTIQATDSGGGLSNTLTFSFKVFAASAYSGFVMNGLTLYMEKPANNTQIPNPDQYFQDSQFTFLATAQVPKNATIVSRYSFGSTQNQYQIYRNSNHQFTADFYGTPSGASVTSPIFSNETAYYQVVVIRSSSFLTLYVNNVQSAQVAMASTTVLNSTTLPMMLGSSSLNVVFKNIAYYNRALLPSERLQNYTILGV